MCIFYRRYLSIYVIFLLLHSEYTPLPSVVLHAVLPSIYIDFILSDFQILLILWTHKTPFCAWLWDLPCLLARFHFVVSWPYVERWYLCIETEYDPWSGFLCSIYTSLPHSGETVVVTPSSSMLSLNCS